jgi:hypothetical protein
VLHKLNSAATLIQRTTTEASSESSHSPSVPWIDSETCFAEGIFVLLRTTPAASYGRDSHGAIVPASEYDFGSCERSIDGLPTLRKAGSTSLVRLYV